MRQASLQASVHPSEASQFPGEHGLFPFASAGHEHASLHAFTGSPVLGQTLTPLAAFDCIGQSPEPFGQSPPFGQLLLSQSLLDEQSAILQDAAAGEVEVRVVLLHPTTANAITIDKTNVMIFMSVFPTKNCNNKNKLKNCFATKVT